MDLEELINSIDIVEFLSQFVELEQRGDEWWGLSCFKDEKTPSFSVRKEPPVFFDYSSGIGGNVYTFIRHYNKCSSEDAVEILKQYAGIDNKLTHKKEKLAATMVCKKFKRVKQTKKESSYIVLSEDYMERYEKRDDKLEIWKNEGISDESLDKFQVRYDSFSNRLVYPIRNTDGSIVNIGGRTLDPKWKDKGLRKYTYFYPWGTINTLYGMSENLEDIKKQKEIILFEGCKSVLIADTWGIKNSAAILTSHLSINQFKILAKLGCRVVFALDNDVNIANDHNIKKLKHYVNVECIRDRFSLLDAKDSPVDKGYDVFKKLYDAKIKL